MDFLSEENILGVNLIALVSRASAILAELQRLSKHIPKATSFHYNPLTCKTGIRFIFQRKRIIQRSDV